MDLLKLRKTIERVQLEFDGAKQSQSEQFQLFVISKKDMEEILEAAQYYYETSQDGLE